MLFVDLLFLFFPVFSLDKVLDLSSPKINCIIDIRATVSQSMFEEFLSFSHVGLALLDVSFSCLIDSSVEIVGKVTVLLKTGRQYIADLFGLT